MERKMLTVPSLYLSRPERVGIHSVIAPFIFIRSGLEEALLDEIQGKSCCALNALRTSRPPPTPIRHITSYTEMCFRQELFRTAQSIMAYTESTEMELYFVDALRNEIYRSPRSPGENKRIVRQKIAPGTSLAAYVAYSKMPVFTDDLINDCNYPLGMNKKESLAQRGICIPITTPSNELVAVLELSRDVTMEPYTAVSVFERQSELEMEFEACMNTCNWIGSTIELSHTNLINRKKAEMYEYFQTLLNAYMFEKVPFKQYLSELCNYGVKVLNAQCSAFYIVSSECGIFQGDCENVNFDMYMKTDDFSHNKKISFGQTVRTVASDACALGKMLNLGKDEIFSNYNIDIYKPLLITSCLAGTSRGYAAGRVVTEVINKQDSIKFGSEDEKLFDHILRYVDFASSCHRLNEETEKMDAFLKIRDETLLHLMEPCRHSVMEYKKNILHRPSDLYTISFVSEDNYVTCCKLLDLLFTDTIYRWTLLPYYTKCRFLLMVHKASILSQAQDFRKIFSSVHFVATIIKWNPGVFSEVEKELLMYSALCHAVNAPEPQQLGTATDLEAFPDATKTNFSTSFYYAKLIFKACKMFSDESETEMMLNRMSKLMEACYHVRLIGKDEKILFILAKKTFDFKKPRHRHLLRICVMAVAGFAIHFKPFIVSLECELKKSCESTNCTLMDSKNPNEKFSNVNRLELGEMQKNLLDTVIIPWAITLRNILPTATSIIFKLLEERENWSEITQINISRDCWIPMKVEPKENRKLEILNFIESQPKSTKRKRSSTSSKEF